MIEQATFLEELANEVPESADLVAEHLADHDELLLHVLMSDLLRLTVSAYASGEVAVTDRLLAFVDRCLTGGDEFVSNAAAVSFIEDFGVAPGESESLLQRWPAAMRAVLGR